MSSATDDIAAAAARLVVEEGLEYGAAKRKAARDLSRRHGRRSELPSNEAIEDEVRDYLSLFQADTQPGELPALRRLAAGWMERLAAVPSASGRRGLARHRDAPLGAADRAVLRRLEGGRDRADRPAHPVRHRSARADGPDVLSVDATCAELGDSVAIFLHVLDHDDLRGALKPDARGRT